jgi:ABC-type multidrug transport system permease subunit
MSIYNISSFNRFFIIPKKNYPRWCAIVSRTLIITLLLQLQCQSFLFLRNNLQLSYKYNLPLQILNLRLQDYYVGN